MPKPSIALSKIGNGRRPSLSRGQALNHTTAGARTARKGHAAVVAATTPRLRTRPHRIAIARVTYSNDSSRLHLVSADLRASLVLSQTEPGTGHALNAVPSPKGRTMRGRCILRYGHIMNISILKDRTSVRCVGAMRSYTWVHGERRSDEVEAAKRRG